MLTRSFIPMAPFSELRRELDRAFRDVLGGWDGGPTRQAPSFPAVNLWEDGDAFYAEAEVPGVGMNDLEILAVGNELTIKGERLGREEQDASYLRQERGTGAFTRVVTLPGEVNANKVEATLKDGVLTIVMPKAEAARARKIQVKGS